MRTVGGLAVAQWSLDRARRCTVVLALGAVSLALAQAQTPGAKGPADSAGTVGFSIESEMLTYRALESNSEAIACDITGFLNGTTPNFTSPPPGMVCDVRAGSHNASIVLLPFDKSTFADFQLWRADMATMDRLQRKAANFDCPAGAQAKGAAVAAASSALDLTPAGPMLNAAQGVLGLLATEEATSPVTGTIQDQAFMNGVGRQLRALKVPVIMPTGFSPYSLAPLDQTSSPFLAGLARTLNAEGCLTALAQKDRADVAAIRDTIAEIDKFRASLDAVTPEKKGQSDSPAAQTDDEVKQTKAASTTVPASTASHLPAVLFADGLAQALGVDPATGKIPDNGVSQHILLLKALESGGSVTRNSNILGTKVRFSGGFVGTYALFTAAGDLECSGNVYDFGGSIKAKNFQRELSKYNIEPGKQLIFQRGNCLSSTPGH
jgi:hypothetical protein